jgi:hypothetical protein
MWERLLTAPGVFSLVTSLISNRAQRCLTSVIKWEHLAALMYWQNWRKNSALLDVGEQNGTGTTHVARRHSPLPALLLK